MPAPGRNFCRRDGIEGFSFFQEAYSAGFQQGYQWLQEHTKEFIIRRKNEHYRSKDEPDQKLLRLTDAFAEEGAPEESCLECCATMLNINYGHNYELMEKCRRLEEYSVFVAEVRKALEEGGDQRQAVDDAIDICIEKGVLRDILIKERAAIMNMVLSCTEKQYDRLVRKELEQQEKRIKEQEDRMRRQQGQIEEQDSQMRRQQETIRDQERLLELNRILVRERKYDLLEQIQDDPALCEELMVQYGV